MSAIRQLVDAGDHGLLNDAMNILWASHCHPEASDNIAFVSKDLNSLNKYEFDIGTLPDKTFWSAYRHLGL